MKLYDQAEEFLDEKNEIALDFVGTRKQQIFSELIDLGLSEDEIKEIIDNWRSVLTKGETKKEGIFTLQGVAACLHVFEVLSHSARQKTANERLAFKESLANLGTLLVMLGGVAIHGEEKNAQMMLEQIQESEERVKRQGTEKARETRKQRADENRAAVVTFYREMKKKNPKTTKSIATKEFYDGPNKKLNLSLDTIRGYLRNV